MFRNGKQGAGGKVDWKGSVSRCQGDRRNQISGEFPIRGLPRVDVVLRVPDQDGHGLKYSLDLHLFPTDPFGLLVRESRQGNLKAILLEGLHEDPGEVLPRDRDRIRTTQTNNRERSASSGCR